jgi:hypothetical protein
MKTSSDSVVSASRVSFLRQLGRLSTVLGVSALILSASNSLLAQAPGDQNRDQRKRGDGSQGDRGNMNPQDMQARMLTALRERLEITDDEEWKVISERLLKLNELRRSVSGGMFGGRGGPPGGGGDRGSDRGGGQRPGSTSNPELTALSSAVRDKLPDAEVKTRLVRLREVRKENELKLTKAQEELRAVLSVRQEAVAVIFGLLP